MNVKIDQKNNSKVAIVKSSEFLISNVQDALDLLASIQQIHETNKIVVHQNNITKEFFDLKTKLAGNILQKFVNYRIKLAILGNFEEYTSESFKDFIYECNKGKQIFFLKNRSEEHTSELQSRGHIVCRLLLE